MKDRDFMAVARRTVEQAIGERLDGAPLEASALGKSKRTASRGRPGGLKGGKARAAKLSAKRRHQIAKKAAKKRWGGNKKGG